MANFNDAEITSLYVGQQTSPGVQDDAPNAPGGGPFNLTLEMVAGTGLQTEQYTLAITCSDLSATSAAPAGSPLIPPSGPLNGPGNFGEGPWLQSGTSGQWWTLSVPVLVGPEPVGGQGHVYQYTAALYTKNGQVASVKQSNPFILI